MEISKGQELFYEDIGIKVRAYFFDHHLYVEGKVGTRVRMTCSLCLKEFTQVIGNEKFAYDCKIEGREVIDLTDAIREDIIVALPIRPLCISDCKGLCRSCGKDLNENACRCKPEERPRKGPFDILRKIKL